MTAPGGRPKPARGLLRGCLVVIALLVSVVGAWFWLLFDDAAFARRFNGVCAATPMGITAEEFKARFVEGEWRFQEKPGELWAAHTARVHLDAHVVCVVQVREGLLVGRGRAEPPDARP